MEVPQNTFDVFVETCSNGPLPRGIAVPSAYEIDPLEVACRLLIKRIRRMTTGRFDG